MAAAESLIRLRDPHGIEHMLTVLNDPRGDDLSESDYGLDMLGMLGGVEQLPRMLSSNPDKDIRRTAALVLACADEPFAAEALGSASKQDNAVEVREAVAEALDVILTLKRGRTRDLLFEMSR